MTLIYRDLKINDLKQCSELFVEAFLQQPWNECWSDQQAYERLSQMMSSPYSLGFVIEDDGQVVGMVIGRVLRYLSDLELIIEEICISNHYRGQHLGTYLLDYLKQECLKRNIQSLSLNTIKSFLSDEFYTQNGFIEQNHIVYMNCCIKNGKNS